MALTRTGKPHVTTQHALLTGLIDGTVTLPAGQLVVPDGTLVIPSPVTYDVTNDVIEAQSQLHALYVAHLIGTWHNSQAQADPAHPHGHVCNHRCPTQIVDPGAGEVVMALSAMSAALAKQMADALDASDASVNYAAYVSLHTGSTSTSGANECSDSGYARQACSWNASSGTTTITKTNSSTLSFTTTGTTITDAGTFTASTSGTFGIELVLGSSVSADTITVAAAALSLTTTG